ncbi:hypothetical protein [Maribacter antarcticus]|uniref:hypothetical protein n=1 Tax=Maribacter antarcticus TaxID=505250 RepID=UPI00047BFF91|nr:hypothetical protein [Maribacter antarcticus]
MSRGKKKEEHNPYTPNFNFVILKLLSKAFDKGQLFYMVFGLIIVISVMKIPGGEILPFIENVIQLLENFSILGWALFVAIVLISTFRVKYLKKIHQFEIDRISEKKTELQNHLSSRELSSSKKDV